MGGGVADFGEVGLARAVDHPRRAAHEDARVLAGRRHVLAQHQLVDPPRREAPAGRRLARRPAVLLAREPLHRAIGLRPRCEAQLTCTYNPLRGEATAYSKQAEKAQRRSRAHLASRGAARRATP